MMNREPRTEEVVQSTLTENCYFYSGAVHFDGRKMIKGSGRFEIRNPKTGQVFYRGDVNLKGDIQWRRVSGAHTNLHGQFNHSSGYWTISFDGDESELNPGEEIVFTYEWTPHYLSGAKVQVEINNEPRMVPIEDLQAALYSYLGE